MLTLFLCLHSGRGRRSPKQRLREQLNGGMMEADKDHLITEDGDAVYRRCPGVNNVAYVVSRNSRSTSTAQELPDIQIVLCSESSRTLTKALAPL